MKKETPQPETPPSPFISGVFHALAAFCIISSVGSLLRMIFGLVVSHELHSAYGFGCIYLFIASITLWSWAALLTWLYRISISIEEIRVNSNTAGLIKDVHVLADECRERKIVAEQQRIKEAENKLLSMTSSQY